MTLKPDPEAAKQAWRELLAKIVIDFDRHAGAFAGLKYNSPWIAATEEWAERSGHTVDELREVITQKRTALIMRREMDARIKRAYEDFRRAGQEWRKETGYQDPPFRLTPEDQRFPNYKELKSRIWKVGASVGFDQADIVYELGDLSFGGFIHDRLGHRVSLRMTVKLRVDGEIELRVTLPYSQLGEVISLALHTLLTARFLLKELGLPQMSELEWVATKSKTDFKEVDGILAIMKAIASHLRPTIH